MNLKFVDRKNIREEFSKDIKNSVGRNKVVILSGGQGIGKSALSKKISEESNSHIFIHVKTKFRANKGVASGSFYKSFVNSTIDLRERGEIPGFVDYMKNKPKETLTRLGASLVKAASKFDPIASKIVSLSENINNIADKDIKGLISSKNVEIKIQYSSYIVSSLKDKNILISIENAQCMDDEFIEFIQRMLENCNSVYCIFEYTKNVVSDLLEEEIEESFCVIQNILYDHIELKRLPSRYAISIVSSNDKKSLKIIKKYYEQSDGNLKPLHQMAEYRGETLSKTINSISNSEYGIEEVTIEAFNSLSDDAKLILAIIQIEDISLNIEALKLLLSYLKIKCDASKLRKDLESLERKEFIEIGTSHISLKDDVSYRRIGGDNYLGRYEEIALSLWRKYYLDTKSETIQLSYDERLFNRLKIAYRLKDKSELLSVFHDCIHQASVSSYPRLYLSPLSEWILEERESQVWSDFISELITACVDYTEFDLALVLSKKINEGKYSSIDTKTKHCYILTKISKHEECLKYISIIESQYKLSLNESIYLKINEFTSLYYMSKFNKCRKIYSKVLKDIGNSEGLATASLLTCSPMVNDSKKSIRDLEKATSIFYRGGARKSFHRTQVKLSIRYARSGNIEKSKLLLDSAEEGLKEIKIDRNIIINNRCALSLQSNTSDQNIIEYLNEILITSNAIYDRVIIINNLIIAHYKLGDVEHTIEHANSLALLLSGNTDIDYGIYWTVRKNLSYIEKNMEIENISERIPSYKLSNIPVHELCQLVDDGIEPSNHIDKYFYNMNLRPMYLAHWSIDFS